MTSKDNSTNAPNPWGRLQSLAASHPRQTSVTAGKLMYEALLASDPQSRRLLLEAYPELPRPALERLAHLVRPDESARYKIPARNEDRRPLPNWPSDWDHVEGRALRIAKIVQATMRRSAAPGSRPASDEGGNEPARDLDQTRQLEIYEALGAIALNAPPQELAPWLETIGEGWRDAWAATAALDDNSPTKLAAGAEQTGVATTRSSATGASDLAF